MRRESRLGWSGSASRPAPTICVKARSLSSASRLISKGFDLRVYDPSVSAAYAHNMGGSGRGNGIVPDLKERLVSKIDELIAGADILLVGNRYEEAVEPLTEAASTKSLVDLTRINPKMRSGGLYAGICW